MRFFLLFLLCCLNHSTLVPLAAEEATDNADTKSDNTAADDFKLVFITGEKLIYVYQTKQVTTQHINDDEIHIESTIAWQFALRCSEQNDETALLQLNILFIKAAVKAPKFNHSIDTSIDNTQSSTPVIGHLALLNGKRITLSYDKQSQRVTKVSGAENILAAFRKKYPKDEFDDVEHPLFLQAKQQFSNAALLRIWREIIRPPQNGQEQITLDAPLNLTIIREWQEPDSDNISSYGIQPYSFTAPATDANDDTPNTSDPIMIPLTVGPNPVEARLRHLEASGKLLLRNDAVAEATGHIHAKMDFLALTTDFTQDLELTWQLLLTKRLEASQVAEE